MNLEQFIQESLTQILRGVGNAKVVAIEVGGEVNPRLYGKVGTYGKDGRNVENIKFDVAVTVSDESGASGGISVMGIGAKGNIAEKNSTVSRIQFSVPISLSE